MATQTKSNRSELQFARTKANKIRKLTKQLRLNPNDQGAKKALDFWQTHDRKTKKHRR